MNSHGKSLIVAILASLIGPFFDNQVSALSAASSDTYYVAKDGNDSNPGTITGPYRSIAKCLSVITAGETCIIRSGTYAENLGGSTTLPSGTSFSNAVSVKAYPGETVMIAPGRGDAIFDPAHGEHYIIFQDLIFDATGVTFGIGGNNHPHHIRLVNCEIKNARRSGIIPHGDFWEFLNCNVHHNGTNVGGVPQDHGYYISGTDNLIDGGSSHDNWGAGAQIYGTGQMNVNRNVIRNTRMYNNGAGFILASGDDNVAYNNLVYNNKGTGASIAESGYSNRGALYNNTVYGNDGYGLLVGAGSTNAEMKNNIAYKNGPTNIYDLGSRSSLSNNSTSDPLFTNPVSGDFTVRSSSGTIDAGLDLSWLFGTDMAGAPRPQGRAFDIGAYEYGGGTSTANPTPPPAPPPVTPPAGGDTPTVCSPATTVYVAKDGNDSNCGTISTPYQSIAKCLSVIRAGDSCIIRSGIYAENLGGNTILPSGTSFSSAVTVKAYPGETVAIAPRRGDAILDPAHGEHYIIFQDLVFDATGVTFGIGGNGRPHHIRLLNCEVKNARKSGIIPHGDFWELINCNVHHNGSPSNGNQDHGAYLSGADNLIDGGIWHDNEGGILIYDSGSNIVSRNVVRNTRIYNNSLSQAGGGGLMISNGVDNFAYNNLIYNNGNTALSISESGGSTRNVLYNNTVYGNTGIAVLIGAASYNAEVKNNIVYKNGAGIINYGYNSSIGNNSTADPLFTNAVSGDFTVRSSSATIDAGVDLSWLFATDIAGTPRPRGRAFDIGAYEYDGATSSNVPPTVPIAPPADGAAGSSAITVTVAAKIFCVAKNGDITECPPVITPGATFGNSASEKNLKSPEALTSRTESRIVQLLQYSIFLQLARSPSGHSLAAVRPRDCHITLRSPIRSG